MDEAGRLRADLFELYALTDTLIEDERDRALLQACEEAILDRLDRLAVIERAEHRPRNL